MSIKNLVIVPARSGSKGIADKNIKNLCGQPLLSWTVRAIQQANLEQSFAMLSTDSEVYAQIGRDLGLVAPFIRPLEYATDTSSAFDVIEHALRWFEAKYVCQPECIMWLQPTSPFRSSAIIRQALDIMTSQQADAVIGCKEIHRDLTTLFRYDDCFLSPLNSEKPTLTARQLIKPLLTPNGAMYLCKTTHFLENKSFYPERTVPLIMNAIQSLDIDTDEDWAIAEAFVKQGLV